MSNVQPTSLSQDGRNRLRRFLYGIPTSLPEFVYTTVLRPAPLKRAANAVIRVVAPSSVRLGRYRLSLNPSDPVVTGALALRVYERSETACFRRLCRPGMTVIDIGANVGYYTVLAASIVGAGGRILAFEPDPENALYLRRNATQNGFANVDVHAVALADCDGVLTLYRSASNRADNRIYASQGDWSRVDVPVRPLDAVLQQAGIQRVDLIKMDVQGAEGLAIAGMHDALRRNPQVVMLMEFWPEGMRMAGTPPRDVLGALDSLGLTVFALGRNGRLKPVRDFAHLIERFPGRRYTNLVVANRRPY